jgi:hypothetical protein
MKEQQLATPPISNEDMGSHTISEDTPRTQKGNSPLRRQPYLIQPGLGVCMVAYAVCFSQPMIIILELKSNYIPIALVLLSVVFPSLKEHRI